MQKINKLKAYSFVGFSTGLIAFIAFIVNEPVSLPISASIQNFSTLSSPTNLNTTINISDFRSGLSIGIR